MSTRPRRLVLLTLTLAFAGCAQVPSPSSTAAPSAPPSAPPTETPASSQASASISPAASQAAGQSDSEWGRIWDTVPAGFPRFPGSTDADTTGPEPVSARYAIPGGDAQAIAVWMQDGLEKATFSTEGMNGPFEDGGYVIDSVGEGDCRLQTRISPEGDATFVEVMYGAGCPEPAS